MQKKFYIVAVWIAALVLCLGNTSRAAENARVPLSKIPNQDVTTRQVSMARDALTTCRAFCVGWAVGGASDGYAAILRTDDSGTTWKRQGSIDTLPNITLNGVSAVDEQHAWAVGEKTILHTRNGGLTWEQQKLPDNLPADFELFQVKALDNRIAFAVGSAGVLLRLEEPTRAQRGEWVQMPTEANMPLIQYSDIDAADAAHVWAVGGIVSGNKPRTGLAISFYDGVRWRTQMVTHSLNDCSSFIGVSVIDQYTAWAVGGLNCPPYRTTDGGVSWKPVGKPLAPGLYDTNRVVAVTRNLIWITTDDGIYRTTNGGGTWQVMRSGCGVRAVCYGVSAAGTNYAWANNLASSGQSALFRWVNGTRWKTYSAPAATSVTMISFVGARR